MYHSVHAEVIRQLSSPFSPLISQVLGMELRTAGLATSAFAHWISFPTPICLFWDRVLRNPGCTEGWPWTSSVTGASPELLIPPPYSWGVLWPCVTMCDHVLQWLVVWTHLLFTITSSFKSKKLKLKESIWHWAWRLTPLVPTLRRKRREGLCEFQASLSYSARACFFT